MVPVSAAAGGLQPGPRVAFAAAAAADGERTGDGLDSPLDFGSATPILPGSSSGGIGVVHVAPGDVSLTGNKLLSMTGEPSSVARGVGRGHGCWLARVFRVRACTFAAMCVLQFVRV